MASFVMRKEWDRVKNVENDECEAHNMVSAAAKMICQEIRNFDYSREYYPTESDISDITAADRFIPSLLSNLISKLVIDRVKQVAICNAIVQAARPRSVISPILLGTGVQMDHNFGSKWLIDELARLGFSVSSSEVYRYKQSVLQATPHEIDPEKRYPQRFTQWVGDNVDHNVATLDGGNSFHGMGIIAVSSKCDKDVPGIALSPIKRIQRMKAIESIKNLGLPLKEYVRPDTKPLSSVVIEELKPLVKPMSLFHAVKLDLIWNCGWLRAKPEIGRPNWSGFMERVASRDSELKKGVSDVTLLPIVDLNPSDSTCIYSTLCFIADQAKVLGIPTPCVTFDQPLWLKAFEISKASSMNIVCRLGGFHMLMSFIGSVGFLMEGSGLSDALEQCYGPNTVVHMLSGKSISRAIRGLTLIDSALTILLLKQLIERKDQEMVTSLSDEELQQLTVIYEELLEGRNHVTSETVYLSASVAKLEEMLVTLKDELEQSSRTARLWLQFQYHMETVRLFIRAERLSDWKLHLFATRRMLNLFAATGHFNYTKCARLYLQTMENLENDHEWLYQQFHDHGFQSVRRSDRNWAGIWTDLAIEQILMRSVKSRGGLTRGRGFSEAVRLTWVHTMHQCASVHQAMTSLTELTHATSDQHEELEVSRVKRDNTDLNKILNWFNNHNPFSMNETSLYCLSTGLMSVEDDGINCDDAENVGAGIQNEMNMKPFTEIKLIRKRIIKSLTHLRKGVRADNETIHMNNGSLFNRLIVLGERKSDMAFMFSFELTPVPSSLFKDDMMRKPDKAVLSKVISKNAWCNGSDGEQTYYVLDGGALLHRVRWMKGLTYLEIAKQYLNFIGKRYGRNACIVFDGYSSGPSTKDQEHQRRSSKVFAAVNVSDDAIAHTNQALFLANSENKARFIEFLIGYLESSAYRVTQAPGDADTLIVRVALEMAVNKQHVTVVADDTDVLVLLVHHWRPHMANVLMRREAKPTRSAAQQIDYGDSSASNMERPSSQLRFISVSLIQKSLGESTVNKLLVIHALSGCDTTSAIHGHGKTTALKKWTDSKLSHLCHTLSNSSSAEEVGDAGCKLLVALCGGTPGFETLDQRRYTTYMKLCCSSKSAILPEHLPPTQRAGYYHSLRAHLQIVEWQQLSPGCLSAVDWGWKVKHGKLEPITTDLNAAPDEVLKVIRCNCKTTSRKVCSTSLCSCKRNSLPCVSACGNCHGDNCNNSEKEPDFDQESHTDLMDTCYADDDPALGYDKVNDEEVEVYEEDLELVMLGINEEIV